jgi:hypothetical protein
MRTLAEWESGVKWKISLDTFSTVVYGCRMRTVKDVVIHVKLPKALYDRIKMNAHLGDRTIHAQVVRTLRLSVENGDKP